MKRSGKQLPSRANFSTFLQFNCSNFRLKYVKSLRVTNIVKEIKFEGVLGSLQAKDCFQTQIFTHKICEINFSFHAKYRTNGKF